MKFLPTLLLCILFSGCALLRPKNPFDPSTLGTQALVDLVASPDTREKVVTASLRELSARNLSPQEASTLSASLPTQKQDVRWEILSMLIAKKMTHLYPEMITRSRETADTLTAVAYLHTASALMPASPLLRNDLGTFLLEGGSPELRVHAAKFLVERFPREAEHFFIQALEKENSATVATYMTMFLAEKGTAESLPLLTRLSNDLDRRFTDDKLLGPACNTETVRAAAVRGVERLRAPPRPRRLM
jgi:hypothetical protein